MGHKTPDHIVRRIVRERAAGRTMQSIADDLNADLVPMAQNGSCWKTGTIDALLKRAKRDGINLQVVA